MFNVKYVVEGNKCYIFIIYTYNLYIDLKFSQGYLTLWPHSSSI